MKKIINQSLSNLEDAFRLECDQENINNDDIGKNIYKYLKKRKRATKVINFIFTYIIKE